MTRKNRLADETSPYLLQHAENPVDWYPWGDEAFEKAKTEGKPIFLSVGYSACHWCHVMERESFESERIAELLNESFISVKVDREERPDVDSIYMSAVQMMTGHGGWPMSVFLTPDGRPFFGGTYFPPEDMRGMPGFDRILDHVKTLWRDRRDVVEEAAGEVGGALARSFSVEIAETSVDRDALTRAANKLIDHYDRVNGGFGGAPKFPPAMTLDWLLQVASRTENEQLIEVVQHTLLAMANGGIYDHLGGGFARYSVDEKWLVPHFEKMLYDNALLIPAYLHGWQVSGDARFLSVVEETIAWLEREMTSPEGGFYSTLDADSEGVEGKFYVWSLEEIREVLGDDAAPFADFYGVTSAGNFEGANILHRRMTTEEAARTYGISPEDLDTLLASGRSKLLARREERIGPGRDDKIIAGWNGWMLAAVAEAALLTGREDWRTLAERNAEFLVETFVEGGRVRRIHKDGQTRIMGMLEDYGGLCWGLLAAFELLQDRRLLEVAERLARSVVERFGRDEGGFFDVADDHEQLVTRPRDLFDNATPAGSSLAIRSLQKLALFLGDPSLERAAANALRGSVGIALEHPSGFGFLLQAAEWDAGKPLELVLSGAPGETPLWSALGPVYLPGRIIVSADVEGLPVTEGKSEDQPTAWLCRGYTCSAPIHDVDVLREELRKTSRD